MRTHKQDSGVFIKLGKRECGYKAVSEFIKKYYMNNLNEGREILYDVEYSYNGRRFDRITDLVIIEGYNDDLHFGFMMDWWEGQQYIKINGIKAVRCFRITGGIYELQDI